MFLPFSKRAKEWEPHALRLRAMVRGNLGEVRFDPAELAPKVGLTLAPVTFRGLSLDELRHLRTEGRSRWSGGVYPVPLPDGSYLCMLNPDDPPRRNRITLMEEICHRHFKHTPTKLVIRADGLLVRDFIDAQEKQAFGVGAAVLMPWSFFFPRLNKGMSSLELSEEFDVTTQLVEYRIKITGATKLYEARQRIRVSAHAVGL